MAQSLDELFAGGRAPSAASRRRNSTPGLVRVQSADPAVDRVLDAAARGDAAVLPQVRDLLRDPGWAASLGSIAATAERYLVRQAAGDDVAVAEALRQRVADHVRRLVADAGDGATFAERLAATRVAHNWLAVHTLEAMAAREDAGGPRAAAVERRLGQAERRLHAALRSLAVLGRLRRPAAPVVAVQANVALGPQHVHNAAGSQPGD